MEVYVSNQEIQPKNQFDLSESINIHIRYRVGKILKGTNIALIIKRNGIDLFCSFDTDTQIDKLEKRLPGVYTYNVSIPPLYLKAGLYSISLSTGRINQVSFEKLIDITTFRIEELSGDVTFKGYLEGRPGMIIPSITWNDEAGS